jgi:hypothetical protein
MARMYTTHLQPVRQFDSSAVRSFGPCQERSALRVFGSSVRCLLAMRKVRSAWSKAPEPESRGQTARRVALCPML